MQNDVKIHKATLGSYGKVIKGDEITEEEAIDEYKANRDVVVCGNDKLANKKAAQRIASTVSKCRRENPHKAAGPFALPHYQPETRPPDGHVFYETDKRKATRKP